MTNQTVAWAVSEAVHQAVGSAFHWSVNRDVNRGVYGAAGWPAGWVAVDRVGYRAVYTAIVQQWHLPHPGLEPYLAGVA